MLYVLYKGGSSKTEYYDGQEPIVHLVASLEKAVEWADRNNLRWAFTDSNAGSHGFRDADASAFLKHRPDTKRRIDRVAELVAGFEPQHGLELLATVHWVAKNEASALPDIIDRTYARGTQKRKFSQRQIETAFDHLCSKKWLRPNLPT
ncbi:MAG: DUF4433 domain-containing protein [Holophagales bacterium]|jgi:hypothetical protein|nr:DUF4433 domain-containing protein [Holophagales bacterium]